MDTKAVLTISLSSAALIISLAVARLNYVIELERRRENARSAFSSAAAELAKVRSEREELRREIGTAFFDAQHRGARSALGDRRNQYISKMLSAYERQIRGAPFEHLILAAALADTGRIGHAVTHYREAMVGSKDSYSKAEALRVYGRAVYMGGERSQGRQLMREAADEFLRLSDTLDYDRDPMISEAHETLLRLAELETIERPLDRSKNLLGEMAELRSRIGNLQRRERAKLATADLLKWIEETEENENGMAGAVLATHDQSMDLS